MALYNTKKGYSDEALHIIDEARKLAVKILEEYPECSALEVAALINMGAEEGRMIVSIKRRLA